MFQEAIEKFGPGFENRWRGPLRRLAAEDLERAYQRVMPEAQRWESAIKNIPSLYAGQKALVEASHNNDRSEYYLRACPEKRPGEGLIYLPVAGFKNLIPKLKTLILDGHLDEHLYLTAQQLVYIEMSRKN